MSDEVIVAEEPEDKIEVTVSDPKPEVVEDKPDEIAATVEKLRQQLNEEKIARQAAENRATEATKREVSARVEKEDTDLQLINNAIATVKGNASVLKSQYAQALANQDYATAADLQEEISTNAAKLLQLENGKVAMEQRPKPKADAPSDPVEALASQLTPRSASWVRAHPEYARDQRLFNKMINAHNLVVADGISADTDEYFAEIEGILKIRKPDPVVTEEDPTEYTAKVVQQRSSPAAAPVSRSQPGQNGRPNVVRLTAEEREIAGFMGMTPEEYAKNKLSLKKEGRIN